MKLIELLVQELPKRGGWPDGVRNIEMFASGMIFFDGDCAPKEFNLPQCSDGWEKGMGRNYTNAVTREQYEAALAAAQQSVWDGEGLPPVGCECERSWAGDKWLDCRVLFIGDEIVVVKIPTREAAYRLCEVTFRPIRSEADKKREAAVAAMRNFATNYNNSTVIHAINQVYDAIAAGKIPGVKLDV